MARYARASGRPTLYLPGTDHAGIATQVRPPRCPLLSNFTSLMVPSPTIGWKVRQRQQQKRTGMQSLQHHGAQHIPVIIRAKAWSREAGCVAG